MKNKKKKVKEKDENVIEKTVDTQENEEELAPNRFDEFVDGVIEKKDSVKPKGKKTIVLALVSIILFALLLQKENHLDETQKKWPIRNGQ